MYKIYSDNELIYDPTADDYDILDGKLNLRINNSGKLTFTIPRPNPSYGRIKLMKSIITLYDDDDLLIFRGRAYAPNIDLFNNDTIECEGELAFFNDSVMPPFNYETDDLTIILQNIIDNHNNQVSSNKQFILGNVTVTLNDQNKDIIRQSNNYLSTMKLLKDNFLNNLGGYFYLRHQDNITYLDYLEEINYIGEQKVQQSINLIDANKEMTSANLATVVIPLGARIKNESSDEEEYLTIESLTGKKYLENEDAIETYGRIVKVVYHDKITTAQELLAAGQKDLADFLGINTSITLKAADLSKAGYDISTFRLGTYIDVKVQNLEIDTKMLIEALSIDLLKPESNTISIGKQEKTMTDWHNETTKSIEKTYINLQENIKETADDAVVRSIREANSNIEQTANEIRTEVSESYYNKEKSDELLEKVYTTIDQTAEGIELNFNHYKEIQENINGDTQAKFIEINKYIRFVDGDILLGEESNPLTLRIENDRIVFIENGVEIAYWRNRKFYAVDGEFINSLKLGKFAFIPRETGNLSFTKVEE